VGTTPTSGPGGGSATVTSREQLTGHDVDIDDGTSANLTWDTSNGPNVLLDRTDISNPVVVAAGVYAVAVIVRGTNLTAGSRYVAQLNLDANGDDPYVWADSAPSSALDNDPLLALALTYYIPAGGRITLAVSNEDGASDRNFRLVNASIQRLS
jgi:hypothetical protein